MSSTSILIAGFGGQGVMLIGQMLTYGAMEEKKEVTYMPSYGPEMRGGTANVTVCISEEPISSPVVSKCDVLVVMNEPSFEKFLPILKPKGNLFINSAVIRERVERNDVQVHYVDTLKIAEVKTGNGKMANMVMLGAVLKITEILQKETMERVFKKTLTGEKAKFIPGNVQALDAWEEGR